MSRLELDGYHENGTSPFSGNESKTRKQIERVNLVVIEILKQISIEDIALFRFVQETSIRDAKKPAHKKRFLSNIF